MQPCLEHRPELPGQAQQRVAGAACPGRRARGQDPLELAIVQAGDHRRCQHAGRNAGPGQPPDRVQPPVRRRRTRLHPARQLRIERGDRHPRAHQAAFRHGRQDVQVADDAAALGDDADRMVEAVQHLQHLPGQGQGAVHRLVGIGVGTERDLARDVARASQLPFQQPGDLRLEGEPGLEVEPRRIAKIGVARPRVAVDAAMLAAAIRVEGAVEAEVGAGVARDGAPAEVGGQGGRHRWRRCLLNRDAVPAVVERLHQRRIEAVAAIGRHAASLAGWRCLVTRLLPTRLWLIKHSGPSRLRRIRAGAASWRFQGAQARTHREQTAAGSRLAARKPWATRTGRDTMVGLERAGSHALPPCVPTRDIPSTCP